MGKKYVVLTKSGYLQDNLSCGVSDTATKLDFDKAVKAADLIGGEVRAIEEWGIGMTTLYSQGRHFVPEMQMDFRDEGKYICITFGWDGNGRLAAVRAAGRMGNKMGLNVSRPSYDCNDTIRSVHISVRSNKDRRKLANFLTYLKGKRFSKIANNNGYLWAM